MAKYEKRGKGNFNEVVNAIHEAAMTGSSSISLEESSSKTINGVRIDIKAYERYAYFGKNRASLVVTIMGYEDNIFVTAIATGGSQAIFFKINTWSEASFLDTVIRTIDKVVK